jgi:TonB family protein
MLLAIGAFVPRGGASATESTVEVDPKTLPDCRSPDIVSPRVTETSLLPYPERLRQQWVEGHVAFSLMVLEDGTARVLEVLESDPKGLFDAAAHAGVRAWRFRPASRNGSLVLCRMKLRVRFQLDDEILPGAERLPPWVRWLQAEYRARPTISREGIESAEGASGVAVIRYMPDPFGVAEDVTLVSSTMPTEFTARALEAVRTTTVGRLFPFQDEDGAMLAIFQLAVGVRDALRLDVWEPPTVRLRPDVAQIILPVIPDYPPAASSTGIGGMVVVGFDVDEHGLVSGQRVTLSLPAGVFDAAALDAIAQTIHHPAMVNGARVVSKRQSRTYLFSATYDGKTTRNPQRSPTPLAPRWTYAERLSGEVKIRAVLEPDGSLRGASVVSATPAGVFEQCTLQTIDVRIIEHSWFARLHGRMIATTRRRRIYLRGSAESFFENPEIVLHEFFHVMRQWETRELSVMRYVIEWLRRGYWDNRYEIEAREFAADQLHRFRAMLSRHEAAESPGNAGRETSSPESLRARTARPQTPPAGGPAPG